MYFKKKPITSYRKNPRKKNNSFDSFNNYISSRFSSKRLRRIVNLARPSSSASSIFSQKLNFKKEKNKSFNILNLMIENNPSKFNYKKLKNKMREINNLYSNNKKESSLIPKSTNRIKDLFYNYNVLYGLNTSNVIKTYSPKMRPKSSSVNRFVKKMNMIQRETLTVFTENEVSELIKAKCDDMGIEIKDHMLSKFMDYCNSKCKNRIVDLTENYIGLNSIKFLSNILYNEDRISRLNLSQNNLGDAGVELLINSIKNSYSLIYLNIASNVISYKGGERIFKNIINQQSLLDFNISTLEGSNKNRNRLTSTGIKDIVLYLKNNMFIEYLNLSGNSLKNEGFILICKGLNENQSLNSLKISQNEIEEKGIIQGFKIIKSIINKLTILDISKNKIMDEGLFSLTNQLKYFPNLNSLNISFCGFEFKGFEHLLGALQYNRKLEILNVSGNRLKSKYFDTIRSYFSYLGLRNLNMAKCSLCDESAYELGLCIKHSISIKKLNISDNEITDEGFKSFGTLFYDNLIIESFDCSSNFITDSGIKEFIKSLETNNSLKSINLYDNQFHNETANLIIEILGKNKTLAFINLYYNRIQMSKIDEINKILKFNSENQKMKRMPNLTRSVRNLEFNPEQFTLSTSRIKEKKKEQNILYQKVKEEDKTYTSVKDNHKREIDKKMNILNNIKNQIKEIETRIRNKDKEIEINEKEFILSENELSDKIYEEKNILNDVMSRKTYAEKDLEHIKNENSHVLALTQEKYNLSLRALKKVENSLNIINDELLEKKQKFQNLMQINLFRSSNKKKTTFRQHAKIIRNRSRSTYKTNRDSNSIFSSKFLTKKLINSGKDNKINLSSINEEKKVIKNNNKGNKNILKKKKNSAGSIFFTKNEESKSNKLSNNKGE